MAKAANKATSAAAAAPDAEPVNPLTVELGTVGLKRSGGSVTEEYLTQLQGERGRKVYAEMLTDPLIGGVMLAMKEVIGRLDWRIDAPANANPDEQAQSDFMQECFEDMSDSWDVVLSQALSCVPYGWSLFETVFKYRSGHSADPTRRSAYTDGRIGWRKFALRAQDTLSEWVFDEAGGLRGMLQQDPNGGRNTIPIERAVLFRTDEYKGNPEGVSMLRSAYRPWFFKKKIEEIEATGIERDFAGMPVVYGHPDWFKSTTDPNLLMLFDIVKHAKRNEMDGVVLPALFDDKGNRQVSFELVTSGGSRQINVNEVIGRYNNAIATSMLMDFITLGHEGVGSYALGAAKINMWQLVVESIAKSIAAVVNQHAIPRLMRLNGWAPDRTPELVFGDVAQADLTILGTFLAQMITNGVIVPDETMEAYVRELGGLPPAQMGAREGADMLTPEPTVTDPLAAPADDIDPAKLKVQVDAASALIRSGFDPEASLTLVGLDPIKHLGLLPVTVQRPEAPANPDEQAAADLGVPVEPDTTPAPAAPAPEPATAPAPAEAPTPAADAPVVSTDAPAQ